MSLVFRMDEYISANGTESGGRAYRKCHFRNLSRIQARHRYVLPDFQEANIAHNLIYSHPDTHEIDYVIPNF